MIKKLRAKLILASMFSLALVLLIILGGVNLMSYQNVVSDADSVLTVLASNNGAFPRPQGGLRGEGSAAPGAPEGGKPFLTGPGMSPETPYESRYFWVLLGENGQVIQTQTDQIVAVDEADADAYAATVWASGRTSGFLEDYRYLVSQEADGTRIIFLDCHRSLSSFRITLMASAALSLLGLGAVLVLLLLLSRRIVRPMAESYEKQKRFITDAGHELKTPLTIISADTDLAEMECGENQWLADIRRQAQRLTGLTNDLVYLSRLEEAQPRMQCIEFPISDVVEEMAQSFAAPARNQNQDFALRIQPMLAYTGDEKAIRQVDLPAAGKAGPGPGADGLQLHNPGSEPGERRPPL